MEQSTLFFQKKAIPIAITGLSNAGKTTFVQRLITGEFYDTSLPTFGMNIERFEFKGVLFQLFDLGGQLVFRNYLWKEYVSLSQGIIFIFDSTGEHIDEAKESFWKVAEWAPDDTTVMFLANKWDLEHLDLEGIITKLELPRFATTPSRSFQIFDVSMKTAYNLDNSMNWFTHKLKQSIQARKITVHRLFIFLSSGMPIADLDFGSRDFGSNLISGFMSTINEYIKRTIGDSEGLERVETSNFQVLMISHGQLVCVIFSDIDDSPVKTRTIAESVLRFSAVKFSEEGKTRLTESIREYLLRYFKNEIENL